MYTVEFVTQGGRDASRGGALRRAPRRGREGGPLPSRGPARARAPAPAPQLPPDGHDRDTEGSGTSSTSCISSSCVRGSTAAALASVLGLAAGPEGGGPHCRPPPLAPPEQTSFQRARTPWAFSSASAASHVLSSSGQPTHLTRYWVVPRTVRSAVMRSTS